MAYGAQSKVKIFTHCRKRIGRFRNTHVQYGAMAVVGEEVQVQYLKKKRG